MPDIEIYQEERPWGNFRRFTENCPSTVKIITVRPGESLSLQSHENRSEFWRILRGEGTVQIGEREESVREGDEFMIPVGAKHRVSADATSPTSLEFLEIALGEFNEKDIQRFEDKYDRA